MEVYDRLMKKAEKLVVKLQSDVTTGRKQICENYGQKQVCRFMKKEIEPQDGNLSYLEKCNIKDVLYKVSSIH